MGNQQQKLTENFANQLKFVQKNRKQDGKKKIEMTAQEIAQVWEQISFEYPFFESVSDSAIMTDHRLEDEPIVYCNDEFTQLTGYPKEEILGRNCRFLQGKHTDPKTVQAIRDAIRTGSKLDLELLNYRKDGTPFLNGFCMLPLHERGKKDGKVVYFLAIQKNVTVIVNPWRAPMNQWTIPEVSMWLDKNNCASYVQGFLAKDINGAKLADANVEMLQSCGVVLSSEQTRITRLIQNEKASKLQQQSQNQNQRVDETESVDTSIHQSSRGNREWEDGDESFSEVSQDQSARNKSRSDARPSLGGTARKAAITTNFKGNVRPPVNIIVSSAAVEIGELRRVLRKKMGRKFHVQQLAASKGTTSTLALEIEGAMEGLDLINFVVLEGITDPVIVTDNVGLVVFANDRAWEVFAFPKDPVDTYVLDYFKIAGIGKLDYVSDMRQLRNTVSLVNGAGSFSASTNPVNMGKCKLHVWSFVPSAN